MNQIKNHTDLTIGLMKKLNRFQNLKVQGPEFQVPRGLGLQYFSYKLPRSKSNQKSTFKVVS